MKVCSILCGNFSPVLCHHSIDGFFEVLPGQVPHVDRGLVVPSDDEVVSKRSSYTMEITHQQGNWALWVVQSFAIIRFLLLVLVVVADDGSGQPLLALMFGHYPP